MPLTLMTPHFDDSGCKLIILRPDDRVAGLMQLHGKAAKKAVRPQQKRGIKDTTILTTCIALAVGTLIGRMTVVSIPVMAQTTTEAISLSQLMDTTRALPIKSYDPV